jgi:hypothetical protein
MMSPARQCRLTPEHAALANLAGLSDERRAAFATEILTSIDDPEMFIALGMAARLITQHAQRLGRCAFEKDCL